MIVDIFNSEDFIKANNLKEVTNPVTLDIGFNPTVDGLLSTDIFGRSNDDRKFTFAYISLNEYFLNPIVYKILKRLDRRFEGIVNGTDKYSINSSGELVADENGDTGIKFLYNNIKKIKFKDSNSTMRKERIDILKALSVNEMFMKYLIVIPPFYRDINLQDKDSGKISLGVVNDLYLKVMRMVSMIKKDANNQIDFIGHATRAKVQNLLVEIYDFYTSEIKGKYGIFRKGVLGKTIDNGARSVISAPLFNSESTDEMTVDFYHAGIPLAICCSNFTPYIIKWLKDFFYNELYLNMNKYPVMNKDGEIEYIKLSDPTTYFTDSYIKKNVDSYIHSFNDRFRVIKIPTADGKEISMRFVGRNYIKGTPITESPLISRDATWTDLLYQAAFEVTQDKHVLITRYPLEDYFGIFPNKINVMSTKDTIPVYIGNKLYKNYPKIDPTLTPQRVGTLFIDTVHISNLYLKGLGGDYDGDQVTVRGVYSQEANEEADKLLRSKTNILNISGSNIRTTEKEAIQTIFNLTKADI